MRPPAPCRERPGSGGGGGSAMAEERALAIVTCTAPVNIAVIKYCEYRRPAGGWRLSLGPGPLLGPGESRGATGQAGRRPPVRGGPVAGTRLAPAWGWERAKML